MPLEDEIGIGANLELLMLKYAINDALAKERIEQRLGEIEHSIAMHEEDIEDLKKERMELLVARSGYEIGDRYAFTLEFYKSYPRITQKFGIIKKIDLLSDNQEPHLVLDVIGFEYLASFPISHAKDYLIYAPETE